MKENKLKPSVPVIELFCEELSQNEMLSRLILSHGHDMAMTEIVIANFLEDVALYLKENTKV